MVSWEFERPSEWSMGKRIGFLAIIMLFFGLFLPYWVRDYGNRTDDVAYFQYGTFGLLGLIPLFTIMLIVLMLYLKINIYFEKDEEQVKINHFVLMMWSFCFILIYIADAIRARDYSTLYATAYAGIGLWMIIIGFLLCFIAGYLEWHHPSSEGSRILFTGNKTNSTPIDASPNPKGVVVSSTELKKTVPSARNNRGQKAITKTPRSKQIQDKTSSDTKLMMALNRDPKTKEEKILIRWLRHIQNDGKTYERCLKCGNYVFITVEDKGKTITFKCPDCSSSFTLKK